MIKTNVNSGFSWPPLPPIQNKLDNQKITSTPHAGFSWPPIPIKP